MWLYSRISYVSPLSLADVPSPWRLDGPSPYGDCVVLVTVCTTYSPRAGMSFFPLVVDLIEKSYAAQEAPRWVL